MARMSSATSTKNADPTVDRFGDRDPTARPVVGVEQACFPAGFTMAFGESLDHRGARTLLVVKPESPRELSSALTGRLEISTATTIRHSQLREDVGVTFARLPGTGAKIEASRPTPVRPASALQPSVSARPTA